MNALEAYRRIKHAIATDETRSNLCTVHVHAKPDHTALVATDGHRLSYARLAANGYATRTIDVKAFARAKTSAQVEAAFTSAPASSAVFPDYTRVVPEASADAYTFDVERKVLLDTFEHLLEVNMRTRAVLEHTIALNAAKIAVLAAESAIAQCWLDGKEPAQAPNAALYRAMVDRKNIAESAPVSQPGLTMRVRGLGSSVLTIESCRPESAWVDVAIEPNAASIEAKPLAIGVNATYVIEALKAIKSKTVTITVRDESSPITIEDADGYEIVMPMRI